MRAAGSPHRAGRSLFAATLATIAVNEQCHEYEECDALQPFIDAGKPVFNAEYADEYVDDAAERAALCSDANSLGISTLVLPIDLDDSFRFGCDP